MLRRDWYDQLLIRSDMKKIGFKIDCFYCGRKYELDHKCADRNLFQYVTTMDREMHVMFTESQCSGFSWRYVDVVVQQSQS